MSGPRSSNDILPTDGPAITARLRATLRHADHLARLLEHRAAPPGPTEALRVAELERRVEALERDGQDLAERLVEAEQQSGRLMNLYVATYQLHATLEPAEVKSAIAEITLNILGAERFVLILRGPSGGCEVAMAEGVGDDPLYATGAYRGGDPMIDATLADGTMRLGPVEGSTALAAVPLNVQEVTVGALVLLRLLGHKGALRPEDRDLLDLLAAHAASALFAARLFAMTDRKLRTLEGLVKLARGE